MMGWFGSRGVYIWGGRYCCTADAVQSNKFRWSEDRLTMTVIDVCKYNCTTSSNDLMVIQCNASNQHGYTLTNGYINVFGQHHAHAVSITATK